ncbi:MAG TPA: site-2 protease family protein [Gemmatimonadales bacterium]|nr:site-2 protease family protein [Gemmatimonadales bacterium]
MDILLWAPVLLFSVVAHERAHAVAAHRQGDNTAYLLGRTTWNPLKHIDPIMSIVVPIVLWYASQHTWTFGAAKPVPVNPQNYRNYRRGDIIVSLAGIGANLTIFVLCVGLYILVSLLGTVMPVVVHTVQQMLWWGIWLNLVLAFFNLIPIPPLDGSHVLYHLLPPQLGLQYRQLARFGYLPIMALTFVPGVMNVLLWPADQLMGLATALIRGFTVGGAIA